MKYTLIRCKLILLGGKCDLPPNLWALIGGTRLIPPNYLGLIRRLTGTPYQIHAYEMLAREVYAREIHAREVHAREVHAREPACEVYAN
jgi:hypothetical protein